MASTTTSSLLAQALGVLKTYSTIFILGLIVFSLLWNKFQAGLVKIPGPTLAAYTKFWRVYDVYKGHAHLTAIDLHRRYGPLVRIAPNHVSVADPKMIPVIYTNKEDFTKTAFYPIQSITWKKVPEMNTFSTRDPQEHRDQKRKIANAYSLSTLLQSEEAIDSCSTLFMDRLNEFAAKSESVDLGAWLQFYAFDVVGEITFASKLGFLEKGQDVDGMMKAIEGMLAYAALCGQVPEYHQVLFGNPLFTFLMPAMETWNQVLLFTLKAINSRGLIKEDGELLNADEGGRDMLSRWAHVKSSDPDKISTRDIVVHLTGNVFTGSDTTAIALRAIIYFLCRHPSAMKRAVQEIDKADRQGDLSQPISYKETKSSLPYIGAVVKESMRLHPSVGLLMERLTPPQGATICGQYIPGGTIVGINPWVTTRNEDVFSDPEVFKPERWLESSDAQLKEMESLLSFNFGGGNRTCLGKHISLIEIHKVIPQLLRTFKVELTYPEKEWKICNHWFVKQEGLICTLTRR